MATVQGSLVGFDPGTRVALVCGRFNEIVVERLERGARGALLRHGLDEEAVDTVWVPGAWEVPLAAKALVATGRYAAIVAIGAVVRGDTYHFEVVANQSAGALADLALDATIPVANAILTVDTMEQAFDRAGGKAGNKGAEAALAALEMIGVLRSLG